MNINLFLINSIFFKSLYVTFFKSLIAVSESAFDSFLSELKYKLFSWRAEFNFFSFKLYIFNYFKKN